MKAFFSRIFTAIEAAIVAYPGGVAAVAGIIVAFAARFGFNITLTELAAVYAVAAALIGGFVHAVTVPKARL